MVKKNHFESLLRLYQILLCTKYLIRTDDDRRCFKKYSCNRSTFIKWALCHHVVAYSIVKGTDVFSVKYRKPDNFVP